VPSVYHTYIHVYYIYTCIPRGGSRSEGAVPFVYHTCIHVYYIYTCIHRGGSRSGGR
jgi:hypothetical protein